MHDIQACHPRLCRDPDCASGCGDSPSHCPSCSPLGTPRIVSAHFIGEVSRPLLWVVGEQEALREEDPWLTVGLPCCPQGWAPAAGCAGGTRATGRSQPPGHTVFMGGVGEHGPVITCELLQLPRLGWSPWGRQVMKVQEGASSLGRKFQVWQGGQA